LIQEAVKGVLEEQAISEPLDPDEVKKTVSTILRHGIDEERNGNLIWLHKNKSGAKIWIILSKEGSLTASTQDAHGGSITQSIRTNPMFLQQDLNKILSM